MQILRPVAVLWLMVFTVTQTPAQAPELPQPVLQMANVPVFDCTRPDSPLVHWRVKLGDRAGPVSLSDSMVFVGTNVLRQTLPEREVSPAVLLGVDRVSGEIRWQVRHARLPERANDISGTPIQSRPTIDENRLYYLSNLGELVCLNLNPAGLGNHPSPRVNGLTVEGEGVAVAWCLDLREKLGLFKRDALDWGNPLPSPVISGDLVITATSHGRRSWEGKLDAAAPSLVAANKHTGDIVWTSNLPGEGIVFSQWSSPVIAKLRGRSQLIFPAGDGRLYGLNPADGKLLWQREANPLPGSAEDRGLPGIGFYFPPLLVEGNRIFYSIHGSTSFTVAAVQVWSPRGEALGASQWTFSDAGVINKGGAAVFHEDRIFVAEESGYLLALNSETGRPIWKADLLSPLSDFGSPVIAGKQVLVPTQNGLFAFSTSGLGTCLGRFDLGAPIRGTPVVDGDECHVTTHDHLWCLRLPEVGG